MLELNPKHLSVVERSMGPYDGKSSGEHVCSVLQSMAGELGVRQYLRSRARFGQ